MRQPGDTRQDRAVIGRYTRPEMGHVWSEEHKLRLWCRIETLVLEAHARAGTIPASAVEPVRNAPPPTPGAVAAVEAVTGHDVIAFLSAWADNTQPREAAAYVHYGMTSSDLLDTALALQLTEASELLVAGCDALTAALREHALAHRDTIRVGRTHGIHANIDPAIETEVMAELGLRPADVATQVVLRDGIAEWVSALALAATVCEAVALEVRHCQRTEVAEVAEAFAEGQKGSSAMPHKRNPVRSERICGLARV